MRAMWAVSNPRSWSIESDGTGHRPSHHRNSRSTGQQSETTLAAKYTRSTCQVLRSGVIRLVPVVPLLLGVLGSLGAGCRDKTDIASSGPASAPYESLFDLSIAPAKVERPTTRPSTLDYAAIGEERAAVMAVYDDLGLPGISACSWGETPCADAGWVCPQGVLPRPLRPVASPVDSTGDLPLLVQCNPSTAEIKGGETFEAALISGLEASAHRAASPGGDFWYPPRASEHLIWTTWAHWSLERERTDLFEQAIARVEQTARGRCPPATPHPIAAAVRAMASASLAAGAKRAVEREDWSTARRLGAQALGMLDGPARSCRDGAGAELSARAASRRAELESVAPPPASPMPPATPLGPWVDHWLVRAMRGEAHDARATLSARGAEVLPFLALRTDEIAMIEMPESGGLTEPLVLGDFVQATLNQICTGIGSPRDPTCSPQDIGPRNRRKDPRWPR